LSRRMRASLLATFSGVTNSRRTSELPSRMLRGGEGGGGQREGSGRLACGRPARLHAAHAAAGAHPAQRTQLSAP
jgi:hypothetical protein